MAARRARCFRASSREEIKSDRRAIAAPLRPAKPANEFARSAVIWLQTPRSPPSGLLLGPGEKPTHYI